MSTRKSYDLQHEKRIPLVCVLVLLFVLMTGCSAIDDDLSDCGNEHQLDYELQLVTNMNTELQTELTTQTEVAIANSLRLHLNDIFTDFAHDVDLSFYDTEGDSLRLQHDEHIMDANQASYTLHLPMRKYMHLAVANVVDNPIVALVNDERCHTSLLRQTGNGGTTSHRDTISSHTTGIFTARQPMDVLEGVNQTFNVHLYMANCAAVLVLDPRGQNIDGVRVFSTGFATAFNIADSTYIYSENPPIVRTETITLDESALQAFCSVNFPSRVHYNNNNEAKEDTRSIIQTEEPSIVPIGEEPFWSFEVYIRAADGTITQTCLGIKEPLQGGQLKVFKCWVDEQGAARTDDQEVAVSVKLNWKEGSEFNPDL
ncbi:MAG: hypothetical protein IJP82_11135 [Bacteroidaceae bacterium]|nr:hypothetical protein [Bacteroidaceae bacterium]